MAENSSAINFLQALNSPLEIPIKDNFIKIDQVTEYRKMYIQSKTSLARIVYKDGSTYCNNGGYYSDQLWQVDQVYGSRYYTICNVNGNKAALFFNGKDINCYVGLLYDDQLWKFEYDGSGYYRIINKAHGSKLYLNTEEKFYAYNGPNYDDQLWRLVPDACPLVMLYGMAVGARLVGDYIPRTLCGEVNSNQFWRLIPVEMEDQECPVFFFIHNYANGLKLYHKIDGEFGGFGGNDYPEQHWEVRTLGAHFQFTNRITRGKLFADVKGNVGCYVGPDSIDQLWMLMSTHMKRVRIVSKATGADLAISGTNDWMIFPNLDDGYFLQDSNQSGRVTYKYGEGIFTYTGNVYSDQVWLIDTPENVKGDFFEITHRTTKGKLFIENNSVDIKFDPIPSSEKDHALFYCIWASDASTYDENLIDQISDNNMFWLEDSDGDPYLLPYFPGSLSDILADVQGTVLAGDDEDFFGFQNLDEDCDCVYRVCRDDEDITNGICCSDPDSTRTVAQHIASGSRIPSRYISTTSSRDVALLWAFYRMDTAARSRRQQPLRIIRIHLNRVRGTQQEAGLVNTNNQRVREHFVAGAIHRNYARSSREVLFQDVIPLEMYDILENPEAPPKPPRKRKHKDYFNLSMLLQNMKLE